MTEQVLRTFRFRRARGDLLSGHRTPADAAPVATPAKSPA